MLGVLSSHTTLSLLVGALFKKFGLFLDMPHIVGPLNFESVVCQMFGIMCCLYLLVARHFLCIIFTSNSAGVFFSTIICLIDFTLFNIQYYFVVDMHILYSYIPQYHSHLII